MPRLVVVKPTYWLQTSSSGLELYMWSDVVAVGVNDPNLFANNLIWPGYVLYVITYQSGSQVLRFAIMLPVVQQLRRYDITIFSALMTTKGTKLARDDYLNAVGLGYVVSPCWTVRYDGLKQYLGFVPVAYCSVVTTPMGTEEGDNGGPVYQLVRDPGGAPIGVMAYGVLSGGGVVGIGPFTSQVVNYVAPLDDLLTRVDVKR